MLAVRMKSELKTSPRSARVDSAMWKPNDSRTGAFEVWCFKIRNEQDLILCHTGIVLLASRRTE